MGRIEDLPLFVQRAVRAAVLSALVAGAAAALSAQSPDADALLSRAVVLHQTGDLEGAAALYVEILRQVPGAVRVRSNLGAAYAGLGRFEEAIVEYRRALDEQDDPAIRRNLGLALLKAGRLREATEETLRALAALPSDRDTSLLLADVYIGLGENAKVVTLLTPLAGALPDDKGVAYVLGTALLALGRTADAQAIMDRVFRGDSAEGHVLLGALHAKRHEWPDALADYQKALAADPKLPLLHYLLGDALMRGREDWAAASAAFDAELEGNPYHYESNLLLGTLLFEGGRLSEALPRLELAARLRADDPAAKYALGACYLAVDRLAEALPLLEAASVAAPAHQQTQMKLAVLYTKLGRKDDAARARANAVRLLKQAEAQAFRGGEDVIDRALGVPALEGTAESGGGPPAEKGDTHQQ